MKPPSFLFLYKAGLRSLAEACILWHLAECGVTGSTTPQLASAIGINPNSIHPMLDRLQGMKLIARPKRLDNQGNPYLWILSRLGYRLITGQALKDDSLV